MTDDKKRLFGFGKADVPEVLSINGNGQQTQSILRLRANGKNLLISHRFEVDTYTKLPPPRFLRLCFLDQQVCYMLVQLGIRDILWYRCGRSNQIVDDGSCAGRHCARGEQETLIDRKWDLNHIADKEHLPDYD